MARPSHTYEWGLGEMKKQLLGTTTLVAAGLFAYGGAGQEAFAAEDWSLTAGGYMKAGAHLRLGGR